MDTQILVTEAKRLVTLLDAASAPPKAAALVADELDAWRLWLVPHQSMTDKRTFYTKISTIISEYSNDFVRLNAGLVEEKKADHPAIKGLAQFARVDGLSDLHIRNSSMNGFYLPNCIVIRMTA